MAYFNTTNETDPKLGEFKEKARSQEASIMLHVDLITSRLRTSSWTPSELHAHTLQDAPLTSVRRAINMLTASGRLRKTDRFRIGRYGRKEHVWIKHVEEQS